MLWTIGIAWIAWSIVNGFVADAKNRSSLGVLALSLLLSPFLGSIYILGAPPLPEQRTRAVASVENLQALSTAPSRPNLTPEQREAAARANRQRDIIVLAIVLGSISLAAAAIFYLGK